MKWLLALSLFTNSSRADVLLDLMMEKSYIDDLENDESYTIDDYSEAEHFSWKLQESDDLIIIYSECE